MNKKLMLLALGAVSAMMLAVPAMASAIESLHLHPSPVGAKTIDGIGKATLSTTNGATITCDKVSGGATFEQGGTTGTLQLIFGPNCTTNLGGTCTSTGHASSITTTELPFHLATVLHRTTVNPFDPANPKKPGILVTPNPDTGAHGHFATFTCHVGFLTLNKTVTGNGVVGTIIAPECDGVATSATISFTASSAGVQTDDTLRNTGTTYTLQSNGESAAQEGHATVTMGGNTTLTCT